MQNLAKKVGDFVKVGEALAYVHANNLELGEYAVKELQNTYQISREKIEKTKTKKSWIILLSFC